MIATVFLVLYLACIIAWRKQINKSIAMVREATKVFKSLPVLIVYPLTGVVFSIGLLAYTVAIGAPESPTPAGSYAVTEMDPQPTNHKKGKVIAPGPSDPVGVRYMAYMQIGPGEYAIHGTAWPYWVKLRAAVSLGCIRMLNSDVIQVYNRIKVGTPVVVTN